MTSPTGQVFRIVTDTFIAGDYDLDGDVDGADYLTWKENYGDTGGPADGNGDGAVNAADYTVWRNNFGNSVHALGSGSSPGDSQIPEPACGLLVLQLLTTLVAARTFRSRRGKL
jgi:hypothetical protein